MAQVVTVMNMKGGVGKTTVAMHLGGMLGLGFMGGSPLRVLLIDYDPQFNLSQAWLDPKKYFDLEKNKKTTLSILQDDDANLDPFVLQVPSSRKAPKPSALIETIASSTRGQLDLIPATLDLMYVALGEADSRTTQIRHRFDDFIKQCRAEYNYVIIDCHPAGSVFTRTSLQNSDHVIIPVVSGKYSARGVALMLKFIASSQITGQSPMPHILFNMTTDTPSAEELAIRASSRLAKHCMRQRLKNYKAFSDPVDGRGFVWHSSRPYSTQAYNNLAAVTKEFINRL